MNIFTSYTLVLASLKSVSAISIAAAQPANDMFLNATTIQMNSGIYSGVGTTVGSTPEAGEAGSADFTVWYKWTAPRRGRFSVAFNSETQSFTYVYELNGAASLLNLNLRGKSSDFTSKAPSVLGVSVNAGTIVYAQLAAGSSAAATLSPYEIQASFTPEYASQIAFVTSANRTLGKRDFIRGIVDVPADVAKISVQPAGNGRAYSISFRKSSGEWSFQHRSTAGGQRKRVTYIVTAIGPDGSALDTATRTFSTH